MNKTLGIVFAVVVIFGAAFFISRTPKASDTGAPTTNGGGTNGNQKLSALTLQEIADGETPGGTGQVTFAVADSTNTISGVSEVDATIDNIAVHHFTDGWQTINTPPQTYNLLALNASGKTMLFTQTPATTGRYDKISFSIEKVVVKTTTGREIEATLPSHTVTISTILVVLNKKDSTARFDILASSSLHLMASGDYLFTPVVKTETRNGVSLAVDSSGTVSISGGEVDSVNTWGMNIDGTMQMNFMLNSTANIEITNGVIKLI